MSPAAAAEHDWMRELAQHYGGARCAYPHDKLLLLFDIDGTILDLRYSVLHVLGCYDFVHATSYFSSLKVDDVQSPEVDIDGLLEKATVPRGRSSEIRAWYRDHLWLDSTCHAAHVPFRGVLEIVRWFQLQPGTYVGLNTGRQEAMREVTLASLNRLGAEFRASFDSGLLHMSAGSRDADVLAAKVEAIKSFEAAGYRVFSVIDNEPAVLEVIAHAFGKRVGRPASVGGILLLHADTIFHSRRELLPTCIRTGSRYDVAPLMTRESLPRHTEFVWHDANSRESLARFLQTSIRWAELNVRLHPLTGEPVLGKNSAAGAHAGPALTLRLEEALAPLHRAGRAVKLDLGQGDMLLTAVLDLIDRYRFAESDLWFNGEIECLREQGVRMLAGTKPGAIVQVPVNFVGPLALAAPERAGDVVQMLRDWGVNRMSIGWSTPNKRELMDLLDDLGVEVNIYNVPDLESFLHAILLCPRSISSRYDLTGNGGPSVGLPSDRRAIPQDSSRTSRW